MPDGLFTDLSAEGVLSPDSGLYNLIRKQLGRPDSSIENASTQPSTPGDTNPSTPDTLKPTAPGGTTQPITIDPTADPTAAGQTAKPAGLQPATSPDNSGSAFGSLIDEAGAFLDTSGGRAPQQQQGQQQQQQKTPGGSFNLSPIFAAGADAAGSDPFGNAARTQATSTSNDSSSLMSAIQKLFTAGKGGNEILDLLSKNGDNPNTATGGLDPSQFNLSGNDPAGGINPAGYSLGGTPPASILNPTDYTLGGTGLNAALPDINAPFYGFEGAGTAAGGYAVDGGSSVLAGASSLAGYAPYAGLALSLALNDPHTDAGQSGNASAIAGAGGAAIGASLGAGVAGGAAGGLVALPLILGNLFGKNGFDPDYPAQRRLHETQPRYQGDIDVINSGDKNSILRALGGNITNPDALAAIMGQFNPAIGWQGGDINAAGITTGDNTTYADTLFQKYSNALNGVTPYTQDYQLSSF